MCLFNRNVYLAEVEGKDIPERASKGGGRRGKAGGWGPHGTAGLGSDFPTWEEEIDGRHQEDSEVLVRAGLPRNKSPAPPPLPADWPRLP